jgi:hypothetical protein
LQNAFLPRANAVKSSTATAVANPAGVRGARQPAIPSAASTIAA